MKRLLCSAALFSLSAAPSFAQEMTSIQYAQAKGLLVHGDLYGRPVDMHVTYNPDGTSNTNIVGAAGKGTDLAGKWRADGDKLCTTNALSPLENCFAIPSGKKPGDTFKVTTPGMGEVTVTINE